MGEREIKNAGPSHHFWLQSWVPQVFLSVKVAEGAASPIRAGFVGVGEGEMTRGNDGGKSLFLLLRLFVRRCYFLW